MNVVDYDNAKEISKAINRYIKIKDWVASTAYIVGQYVNNDGVLYKCTTANNDATFNPTNWQKVAGGGLDGWEPSTLYSVDDVVIYNNKIYQCNTTHTSGATFLPDEAKWTEISACITRIPNWVANEDYVVGDLVAYDAKIYRCITAHTSGSTFDSTEEANWEELSPTINEISLWAASTDYKVGQLVIYNNKLFRCTTAHTSTSSFDSDINNWQEISSNEIGSWQPSTTYKVGEFVYKDGQIYRCTTAHTSDSSDFYTDITKWELLDTKWRVENWTDNKYYAIGDVVLYDNRLFKCITANTSSSDFATDYDKWSAISSKLELWKSSTYYSVGDIVVYNNKLYRCKTGHTSTTTLSADIANWDLISSGGIDNWKSNEDYSVNNVVIYNNKIYQCRTAHSAGSTFDYSKWKEISSSDIDLWASNFDYIVGDIVIYDNQLYRCVTAHTSTSDFNDTISRWQVLDTKWQAKDWATNTYYLEGEVVLYDNKPYRCTTTHTSLGTFELDKADWEPLSANIREWVSGNTYKVGDIVIYDGDIWKCVTSNNSVSFEKDKWRQVNKCNIEKWHGAPDSNILALLHFDNSNDLYYNEYGDRFTTGGRLYYAYASGKFGGCAYSTSSYNTTYGITSPSYTYSSNSDVYTIEFWFMIGDHSYSPLYDIWGSPGRGIDTHTWPASFFYGTSYQTSSGFGSWSWNHIAYVLTYDTVELYVNGTLLNTVPRTAGEAVGFNTAGSAGNWNEQFYFDDFRVTKGRVYNGNFTPPTEPFQDPNYDGYKKDDLVVYEDKIYMALVYNNDVQFDKSKWVEVSPCVGIEEWASGSDYTSGDVIIYNNNLYKVVNDVISATDTPDNSNDYVLLGGDSIKTWAGSKEYSAGTIVLHQNILYRNANDIPSSVTTFSRDDWTPLSPVLEDWASSKEYKVGDFVIRNDILYECITDNNDATFNSAKWKPISKEGINAWQSNKQYALYDLVVEDEELYMCISPHTSSSDFQTDLDAERWKLIGGGGGSGGDWNQVTKMNVVAPLDVDINIPYTNTFKRPPVEVLKYEQGTTDITTNVLNFGVGDGSKFEVDGVTAKDSPLITFDGVAKPNHDILYPFGTPTQMVNKYYSESEEIDLDDFKVVGEVSLE